MFALRGLDLKHERFVGSAMSRDEIIAKLVEIMVDVFDVDDLEYDDKLSAVDIEEWDSLSNIRFIVAVEGAFSVRFSNKEVEALQNVGDLVALIQSKSD